MTSADNDRGEYASGPLPLYVRDWQYQLLREATYDRWSVMA
jgi:hypothetical protein